MWLEYVIFFLAAAAAVAGALGVVLIRNPFYSVLMLVIHLFGIATLFLLLRAEFLAAAQIVVYAGAVMVLYIFVVAYIGGQEEPLGESQPLVGTWGPIFAGALLIEIAIAVGGSGLEALDTQGAETGPGFGSPGAIGAALLQKFLIAFEAASILLLVAAVGAVVLARKQRGVYLPHGPERVPLSTNGAPGPVSRTDGEEASESKLLGGSERDQERIPAGTAEATDDPTPERGTWN
jgi:NADH:ubiquinone oxidoreductase subunit 6 (subunit J)